MVERPPISFRSIVPSLIVMDGFRWHVLELGRDVRHADVVELELEPIATVPRRVQVVGASEEADAGREILVAFPFDAPEPTVLVSLGITDAHGVLDIGFLPDGSYMLRGWTEKDRNIGMGRHADPGDSQHPTEILGALAFTGSGCGRFTSNSVVHYAPGSVIRLVLLRNDHITVTFMSL